MLLCSLRRVVLACASGVLLLSSACTEGDEPMLLETRDAGRVDAAVRQDARTSEPDTSVEVMDASTVFDAAREPSATASCGTPAETCYAHVISGVGELAAGCALNFADAQVCGISSQHVLMGAEPKFLEKNAEGIASPSCAAFYDALEAEGDAGARPAASGAGNGRIDKSVTVALNGVPTTLRISYPGCCTERGFCSADGNKGMSEYGPSQSGFGCMESTSFFRYLPELGGAGTAAMGLLLRAIPCDRDSGLIMLPDLDAAVADAALQDAGIADATAGDAQVQEASAAEGGSNDL